MLFFTPLNFSELISKVISAISSEENSREANVARGDADVRISILAVPLPVMVILSAPVVPKSTLRTLIHELGLMFTCRFSDTSLFSVLTLAFFLMLVKSSYSTPPQLAMVSACWRVYGFIFLICFTPVRVGDTVEIVWVVSLTVALFTQIERKMLQSLPMTFLFCISCISDAPW